MKLSGAKILRSIRYSSYISDQTEIEKMTKCYLDGQLYYEKQIMWTTNGCYSCFCTDGFNNLTDMSENSNCIQNECSTLFYYFGDLKKGCVPIFWESHCCPINYKCRKCQ